MFYNFLTLIGDNSFIMGLCNPEWGESVVKMGSPRDFWLNCWEDMKRKSEKRRGEKRERSGPHSHVKLIRTTLLHARYLHVILILTRPTLPFRGLCFQHSTPRAPRGSCGDFGAPPARRRPRVRRRDGDRRRRGRAAHLRLIPNTGLGSGRASLSPLSLPSFRGGP